MTAPAVDVRGTNAQSLVPKILGRYSPVVVNEERIRAFLDIYRRAVESV